MHYILIKLLGGADCATLIITTGIEGYFHIKKMQNDCEQCMYLTKRYRNIGTERVSTCKEAIAFLYLL